VVPSPISPRVSKLPPTPFGPRALRVLGGASRWLALARDVAMAALFRRDETDAFFVAFTIPSALAQMVGDGAVARAVVPVLEKKLKREGEAVALATCHRLRGAFGAVLFLVTLAGVVFAEPLTDLLAPGYRSRSGEFARTVLLTKTVFPFLFLSGLAAVGGAALSLKRRDTFAAVGPVVLNVTFLTAIATLPGLLDARGLDKTQALAVGAILGSALQVALQLHLLRRAGWAGRAVVDLRDPALRDVARRIAPLILGIGIYYVQIVVSRRLLSDLAVGAQSWFSWAMRICEVTQGLFVIGALFPGAATGGGQSDRIAKECTAGVRLALFVSVPASVLLASLSTPVVVAVFQRGELDATSAQETARALVWQGGALFAAGATRHLVRAFYAMRDTRTPLLVSALGVVAFGGLAIGLRSTMGHVGVSAALGVAGVLQMVLLLVPLRLKLSGLRLRSIGATFLRAVGMSLLAMAGGLSTALLLTPRTGANGLTRALPGVLGATVFVFAFVGLAWALRSPELASIRNGARRARKKN
jgi:putative peptidoglycan lipid II flippase